MKCFEANKCRICLKVFCCKDCRALHEEQCHKVNPECEICIYGRATIKDASFSLLNHIKSAHWPLHCVFCKKVFNSLDELVPHDKCTMNMQKPKVDGTPKTPVMPIAELEPSILVTPFYKNIVPGNQQIGATMGATSTPLPKNEEKITPSNNTEIKFIYKSNLKLTGSSSLNESKKSERRVTFCETPSFSDPSKRLAEKKEIRTIRLEAANESDESGEDSYVSVSNQVYKTPPHPQSPSDEKETIDDKITANIKTESNATLWESALTNLEFHNSTVEVNDNATNLYNVAVQINVFNDTVQTPIDDQVTTDVADVSTINKNTSIWSSVSNIVKSVVNNISLTAQSSLSAVSTKRAHPDNDAAIESPYFKRMKLTDLKCRRPIRDLSPLYQIRLAKPQCVDKATQTDDNWK